MADSSKVVQLLASACAALPSKGKGSPALSCSWAAAVTAVTLAVPCRLAVHVDANADCSVGVSGVATLLAWPQCGAQSCILLLALGACTCLCVCAGPRVVCCLFPCRCVVCSPVQQLLQVRLSLLPGNMLLVACTGLASMCLKGASLCTTVHGLLGGEMSGVLCALAALLKTLGVASHLAGLPLLF